MNTRHLLSILVIAVLSLTPTFLLTGCEDEDSPDTGDLDSYFENHPFISDPRNSAFSRVVSISPDSAEITSVGQQVVFTAYGGNGTYTWDTSKHSVGTVSASGNSDTAVYTASVVEPNDVIVYDRDGYAAVAVISGPSTELLATANPGELEIDGDMAVLTASGGVPPYTWTVFDPALGGLNRNNGSSVVYTRTHNPDNSVTVTDSAGNSYSVVIKQPL